MTYIQFAKNRQVSDAGLAVFKDCKNLTLLNLQSTLVSDEGLKNFKGCNQMTFLRLDEGERLGSWWKRGWAWEPRALLSWVPNHQHIKTLTLSTTRS